MCPLIITAVLLGAPSAYEVDFRALPPAAPKGANEYTIVLSFKGEPDVKIPTTIARKFGPEGAADLFMQALSDTAWKIKRDGERITVYGYDDIRILYIKVEGNGPKPVVRRVMIMPPDKKK